jgi:alkanesulfonate monooxygenase SsuD/methylene tetrahydromethanopterin reductase-like flavin-dependent oxidoreductase (luciferase family)
VISQSFRNPALLAKMAATLQVLTGGPTAPTTGSKTRTAEPRPDTPPPIMVGTNGPKALRVAARLADWWNWDASWELVYRRPYEILRGHCEEIGRPFDEITLTAGMSVWFSDDVAEFEATFEHPFYPGQTFDVIGPTPEDAIREIRTLTEVGVSHFQPTFENTATLRRFVDEVLPALA